MKACWLAIATVILGLTGCTGTPKREMKQPEVDEFVLPSTIPAKYDSPPDYPRDDRGFSPKSSGQPFNMSGVGQGSGPSLPGGPSPGMSGRR